MRRRAAPERLQARDVTIGTFSIPRFGEPSNVSASGPASTRRFQGREVGERRREPPCTVWVARHARAPDASHKTCCAAGRYRNCTVYSAVALRNVQRRDGRGLVPRRCDARAAHIGDQVVVLASRVVVLVSRSGGSRRASRDRIVRCLQLLRRTIAMPRGRVDELPWAFRREKPVLGGARPFDCGDRWGLARSDCTAHSAGCTVECAAPRTARNSSRSTASRPRPETGCPVDRAPPCPLVAHRDPVPRPTNCTARKAESHTATHRAHVWPGSR